MTTSIKGFRERRGFTLIELLVVMTLIGLLVALLLPGVGAAMRATRALQCSSAMREIGVAWSVYANENFGRGPGRAFRGAGATGEYSWHDILNRDVFNSSLTVPGTGRPVQRYYFDMTSTPYVRRAAPQSLGCPDLMRTGNQDYWRFMIANVNAVGGPRNNPTHGIDGPAHPFFTSGVQLGTLIARFSNPSRAYLVIESHRNADDSGQVPLSTADNRRQDATTAWPVGGIFAFRHPQLTGNFLTLDGRVERMPHTDSQVNTADRWTF
jgi:prepilin-type N-terminal cleavage/methylation domain-containing protein